MKPVIVQPRAEQDVDEIARGIAASNLDAALRFYDAVAATMDLIARHPGVGTRRSPVDPRLAGLRSFGVTGFRNYLVFFHPAGNATHVVRVLHGARDSDSMMGPIAP